MKGKILGQGFYGAVRDLVTVSFACLCVALINGCASSGPSYEIDYDHSFPFSAYRTYRWYDDDHVTRESQYRRYNSSDQRVRTTASQELMQRGFREATAGKADFWVNYHVAKKQTQKISGQEKGMHGSVGAGTYGKSVSVGYSSGQSVKTYEDGTAIFDVIDVATEKIVWRGVAEGRLKNKMTAADKQQLTITVLHELLTQFPPQQ